MADVSAETQTVRELLSGVKYKIDYYQREYKWGEQQIEELITDLVSKFEEGYKKGDGWKAVGEYPSYFLGPIIIGEKEGDNYIVDGQQRLTSLTLLIIFLDNLQQSLASKGKIPHEKLIPLDALIFSSGVGERPFNLEIEERRPCMEALCEGVATHKVLGADEFVRRYAKEKGAETSVWNLYECYQNIDNHFPEYSRHDEVLLYFIEWLMERVNLVSIQTSSDKDAYTIFETMNDRGLSLSPTDMLKSFVLANVDEERREVVNKLWKERIRDLNNLGKKNANDRAKKEVAADFFKAWLKSQYATKIRQPRKGAKNENFDLIGTEFHRWVGRPGNGIGLKKDDKSSYLKFSTTDFDFYSQQYLMLLKASKIEALGTAEATGLEHVCYNALNSFSLQYMLLLAPLRPEDTQDEITKKIQITARYIDILLTWRLWNSRQITTDGMKYAMFLIMKEIRAYRGRSASELSKFLFEDLQRIQKTEFSFDIKSDSIQSEGLFLKGNNRPQLHRILARITNFVEIQSGGHSRFKEFMEGERRSGGKKVSYEIKHIWADKYERYEDEFDHRAEFSRYRNQLGGLLLLPKKHLAFSRDDSYEKKLDQYLDENLLARSLHPDCYEGHAGFKRFRESTGLEFKSIEDFKKQDIDERGELYREIAKMVWDPKILLEVAEEPKS